MNDAIDKCISGGPDAHFNVASVLDYLLKESHVDSYDFATLSRFCSTQLCQEFMTRANYWSTLSYREKDHTDVFQEKSKVLINIAIKLRNNTYKNIVIKEFNECFAPSSQDHE